MFSSDIKVKIDFDSRPESNDPENLSTAIFVLQDVQTAFGKAGSYCETEIHTLKAAEDILSRIGKGEVFQGKENKS